MDFNDKIEKSISYICKNQYRYFLNKKNVVGVGCGYKVKGGFRTCEKCIQVFVLKKVDKFKLYEKDIIPKNFKGILTDVIETGVLTSYSLTERKRPVQGGYCVSASRDEELFGTIACLVSNGVSKFLLSANHVLTKEGVFDIGKPIIEPAYLHGGRESNDTIATLNKFIPLRPIQGTHEPINLSDCALGLLTEPSILSPEIALVGKLKGVKKSVKLNDDVKKVGCISELTFGTVTSIHATFNIVLPSSKRYLFQDLIITTSMLSKGDSGSLLINKYNYGIGLGFAGNQNLDAYCYLNVVLDQLGVHLVT